MSVFLTTDLGPLYEIDPSGRMRGHGYGAGYLCDEQLDGVAIARLTDLLNAANVMGQSDATCDRCSDLEYFTITTRVTAGAAEGATNSFKYMNGLPQVDDLLAALAGHVAPWEGEGRCDGCPLEIATETCHRAEPGVPRFCRGQVWNVCDGTTEASIIDCADGTRECVADLGWVPAAKYTPGAATLTRMAGSARLDWSLMLENNGLREASWTLDALRTVRLATSAGDQAIDVIDACGGFGSGMADPIGPGTSATADFWTHCDQAWLQSAPALELTIRERPYESSPYAPSVPVMIVDAP